MRDALRDRAGKRILIRPAKIVPIEIYRPDRRAEFLLSHAVDAADYRRARAEVKCMVFALDRIKHRSLKRG